MNRFTRKIEDEKNRKCGEICYNWINSGFEPGKNPNIFQRGDA
jgi:hypothetical protein